MHSTSKRTKLLEDDSELAWLLEGLTLQIKLLKENEIKNLSAGISREADPSKSQIKGGVISRLYPEVAPVERARDCVETFGEYSIEDLKDVLKGTSTAKNHPVCLFCISPIVVIVVLLTSSRLFFRPATPKNDIHVERTLQR